VDPFEKVSGTLGLSGAADAVLILDKDTKGETLYGRGRDVEEIEKAVSFDKLTCRWTILGAAAEVRWTDERAEILSVLIGADEPMSPRDIAVGANMPRNNVDQLVFKMTKEGEVVKAKRGRYVHPERSDLVKAANEAANVHPLFPHKNDKKIRKGVDAEGNGAPDA
jgi:hypothetical protein